MAGTLTPTPYQTVLDGAGVAVSGAKIYTYVAGTTTNAATYTSSALSSANTNPIVADSAGRYVAYLTAGANLRFIIKTSADVLIDDQDNVQSVPGSSVNLDIEGTVGQAVTAGQVLYLSSAAESVPLTAGKWYLTDSDAAATSTTPQSIGVAVSAIAINVAGTIRLAGEVNSAGAVVKGTTYYVGATPGAIVTSAPANSRQVGVGLTTSSLLLAATTAVASLLPNPLTQDLLFVDNTYDIGKAGASRPRDGFFSRNTVVGGTLGVTGAVTLSGGLNTPLVVAQGGTGVAALTANNLLLGAGTGNVTFAAPSTSGNVLTSNGTVWASAVPADSGRRNILYNGAMQLAQRSASVAGLGAASGYFTVDRWDCKVGGLAGRFTMAQVGGGPLAEAGISDCLQFSCTTADTSVAATEYFFLSQSLEGQDVQIIRKGTANAEQLTLSFWVKGNAAATYAAELFDNDNNRQISKTFAVTTSWSKITLTYPADTTGALDDNSANSFSVHFWLHAGTNYTSGTLESAWASTTAANRAAGISSFLDATSRTFFLTGVQLELGATATEFEYRTFGDELESCQRYYEKSYNQGVDPATDTAVGCSGAFLSTSGANGYNIAAQSFMTKKRTTGTYVVYAKSGESGRVSDGNAAVMAAGTGGTNSPGAHGFQLNNASGGAISPTGEHIFWHYTADAEL